MEKKSIGQFIAVLRKANGMTQAQLAEKLNVSDKAVSRWERDENYPDLTLIPVIAEIFGVTSDEILRGERITKEDEENPEKAKKKTEKQLQTMYKGIIQSVSIQSIVWIGVALLGLIIAMVCNLGFLRAHIGFYLACAVYLVAGVMTTITALTLKASVSIMLEFEGEMLDKARYFVYNKLKLTYAVIIMLFAVSLPLAMVGDAMWGLSSDSWLSEGAAFGLVCGVLLYVASYAVDRIVVRKGWIVIPEKKAKRADGVFKRFVILALALVVTFFCQSLFVNIFSKYTFAKPVCFDDPDEFKEYIETTVYYDDNGNRITFEPIAALDWGIGYDVEVIYPGDDYTKPDYNFQKGYIYSKYGNKVLLEYEHRNMDAVTVRERWDGENLTIEVYTRSAIGKGEFFMNLTMIGFVLIYLVEMALFAVSVVKLRRIIG